jgi:hypothetical protein
MPKSPKFTRDSGGQFEGQISRNVVLVQESYINRPAVSSSIQPEQSEIFRRDTLAFVLHVLVLRKDFSCCQSMGQFRAQARRSEGQETQRSNKKRKVLLIS